MGEIHTEVTLENTDDRAYVHRGDRDESEVRHTTVDGIVEHGRRHARAAPRTSSNASGWSSNARRSSRTRTSDATNGPSRAP